ncbi:MAG: hypothetical protein JSS82_18955 [Bacteroidetes bacterium]|nr:hypothetical protein [Bacteroidota bacterium]
MRLMPFNTQAHRLAVDTGYDYILIQKQIDRKHFLHPRDHNLQILKAVKAGSEIPADCACEPVESDRVKYMLQDTETDYFIILMDK